MLGSDDGAAWTVLLSNQSDAIGLDGCPLIVRPRPGKSYRFIMMRLRTEGILHLDEIEVYGSPSDRLVPLIGTALSRDGLS